MIEEFCKSCMDVVPCERGPGAGPHAARLVCAKRKHLIKWLPKERTDDELDRKAEQDRQRRMTIPPTEKQLRFLKNLGGDPSTVTNCQEASEVIGSLLKRYR